MKWSCIECRIDLKYTAMSQLYTENTSSIVFHVEFMFSTVQLCHTCTDKIHEPVLYSMQN